MLLLIPMVFSCIYRRNGKRTIEVYLCLSKKVSVLCTNKNLYFTWKVFDMYKENMYVHKECWDLHREGGPLLVDKQTNENKRKKFVYVWILTKMFWICTRKIEYVHKRIGTYTVREAHDRLRKTRENEFSFIV